MAVAYGGLVPPGLPKHFGFGAIDKWEPDEWNTHGRPHCWKNGHKEEAWDYSYHYLIPGWRHWSAEDGSFALREIIEWGKRGQIQVFTLQYHKKMRFDDTQNMQIYYRDFIKLMEIIAGIKNLNTSVIVHIEPDFLGYCQHPDHEVNGESAHNNRIPPDRENSVMVKSTGLLELKSIPDSIQGWSKAHSILKYKYAGKNIGKVLLAHHYSHWASGNDVFLQGDLTVGQIKTNVDEVTGYIRQVEGDCPSDLIFFDPANRDADFIRIISYKGIRDNSRWTYNEHDFDTTCDDFHVTKRTWGRIGFIVSRVSVNLQKRGMLWQVPVGNTYYKTCDNRSGHFRDNHAQEFLPSSSRFGRSGNPGDIYNPNDKNAGPGFWAERGIIGVLFGSGRYLDYDDINGSLIQNPAGISDKKYTTTHLRNWPDDDIYNPDSEMTTKGWKEKLKEDYPGKTFNIHDPIDEFTLTNRWGMKDSEYTDGDGGYIRLSVARYSNTGKLKLPD